MFPTTIAGSLPKPPWLAEPDRLWPAWRLGGAELDAAKIDATLLAIKLQEDAGIDIVTDGEQSRQHFVHAVLEAVDAIDFANRVEMGIRNNRYKAMVPRVTGPLSLRGRVHAAEARLTRAHTRRKVKFTLPGPMTIVDTVADAHYGDRVALAFAFADLLNREARALEADGIDVIQFDEPAFNVYMDEVTAWGIEALHRSVAASGTLELRHSSDTWPIRLLASAGKIDSYWRHAGPSVAPPRCTSVTATESPPISTGRRIAGAA